MDFGWEATASCRAVGRFEMQKAGDIGDIGSSWWPKNPLHVYAKGKGLLISKITVTVATIK